MPGSRSSKLLQPTLVFPMVSVGILFVLFLIYYFPVTAKQEASLNNRAFRSLAAASDGLQNRIVSYVGVFEKAAKNKSLMPDQKKESQKLISKYLSEQVPGFVLKNPDGTVTCEEGKAQAEARLVDASYFLEFRCGSWYADVAIERILTPQLRGTADQLFDEVVLTDAQGTILYQSLKTGNRISSLLSSAPLSKPGSTTGENKESSAAGTPIADSTRFQGLSQSSDLWAMNLGGTPYKLYIVPVTLKVTSKGQHLVIGGMIRDSRFRAETMAVPGSALISLILLILTIIAATWPLLKFSSMRSTERIPRRSAVYFFLTTLATVILICVLALHLRFIFDLRAVDRNLQILSSAIDLNLESELRQALRVIGAANRSDLFKASLQNYEASQACNDDKLSSKDVVRFPKTRVLNLRGLHFSEYPYFDRIFWTDSRGNQHIKWDVASQPTPATYVGDRSYFVETLKNSLWEFSDAESASSRFRIDPVVSRNTGEYRAVISQRAPAAALCKEVDLSVVSMVTPLMSLIDPVMPPGYGFGLVDERGEVLFHSVPTKNGQENFFNEVEDAGDLREAIFARQGRHLTARYLGYDHRLFVTPLLRMRQNPWSLIVFHDLSERSSQHFERMLLFSSLALLYYAALAAFLMVLPALRRAPVWIWPRVERQGAYIHLILGLLFIAPAFYLLIFSTTWAPAILWVGFIIPIVGVGIAILKQRSMDVVIGAIALVTATLGILETSKESRTGLHLLLIAWLSAAIVLISFPSITRFLGGFKRPSLDNSFAALCALLLIFSGVLPCVAFFKVAYDVQENLSTRTQQLQVIGALTDREERIKARYASLELTPEPDRTDALDVGKWLFLRRRLENATDRYDLAFLNLKPGQIFSGDVDRYGPCEDKLPGMLADLAMLAPSGGDSLARDLIPPASENSTWKWCREATNRLRLTLRRGPATGEAADAFSLPPTRALFKSVTNDPLFLYPDLVSELLFLNRWPWPRAVLVFLAAWAIAFWWIKPTLQTMFLLKTKVREPLPEAILDENIPLSENLILLGFNEAAVSKTLRERDDVFVIDFAKVMRGGAVDFGNIVKPVVAIEHFDYRNDDAEANRKKLDLLEHLAAMKSRKHVLIATSVDPVFYFGEGADLGIGQSLENLMPGQDQDRWSRALLGFKPVRFGGVPSCQAAEKGKIIPEHGRIIWSSCTTAERIVLYQLAHDSWINPRNEAAIEQLQLRGLIKGTPFHFADDGFRKFVSRSVSAEDKKAWEQQESASLWDGIRMMFVVLAIGLIAVVLFFNQQSILGLIFTGISVLTPLTKLLTEANSFRALLGFKTEEKK